MTDDTTERDAASAYRLMHDDLLKRVIAQMTADAFQAFKDAKTDADRREAQAQAHAADRLVSELAMYIQRGETRRHAPRPALA